MTAKEICNLCAYHQRAPMECPIPEGRLSPDCEVQKKIDREREEMVRLRPISIIE